MKIGLRKVTKSAFQSGSSLADEWMEVSSLCCAGKGHIGLILDMTGKFCSFSFRDMMDVSLFLVMWIYIAIHIFFKHGNSPEI